jgi:hypothetical protein
LQAADAEGTEQNTGRKIKPRTAEQSNQRLDLAAEVKSKLVPFVPPKPTAAEQKAKLQAKRKRASDALRLKRAAGRS